MRGARGVALAAGVLAVAAVGAGLILPGIGSGQGAAPVSPQPFLGVVDLETVLMGAASAGEPGEAWAYRRLPLDVAPPVVGGSPLRFGPIADPTSPAPQLAFLRHTDATGWQFVQTPVDRNGDPMRGGVPNALSGRITPRGGGALIVRDTARPAALQATLLVHDAGDPRWRALDPPPPTVLRPAAGPDPAEEIAADRGSGRMAIAAYDTAGTTGVFLAPIGRALEDAVIHWDGGTWQREQVCLQPDVPPGPPDPPCPSEALPEASFQIVALAATSADNAWMLARPDPALNRGIVLFQRTTSSGDPHWVERDLDAPLFSDVATPAENVTEVAPLGGTADSLSVTTAGVWIDGSLKAGTELHDFTLYFDPSSGSGNVTGSWCDAPGQTTADLCDHPLGATFSREEGYQSFAWPDGGPFGSRVMTNPLGLDRNPEANRGTYLSLDGDRFRRRVGAGGNRRRSGAFRSAGDGWLEGPVQITSSPRPDTLRSWPLALRSPLTGVASEPGKRPGALESGALAVGADGAVARYTQAGGWVREFLLTSAGGVSRPTLRDVAWAEPGRAHAVGDLGSMWLWRAETSLWEKDPGAPIGFEGNLMGVEFDPADPARGYAVGKTGLILRYDKSWEPESPPPGLEAADFTSIAFAGSAAIAATGSDVIVNTGSGWQVDQGVRALLAGLPQQPTIVAVAGLPDGGAVAAGRDVVLEKDGPGAPWRFADQPLPGSTVVAAAAFRDGDRVRAVVSVQPRLQYPLPDNIPPLDPNVPPPVIQPFPLAADGYLLRETATGWRDEQRLSFSGSGLDRPVKSDPVLALDLDTNGEGWAVGGWSGEADSAGRGSGARGGVGKVDRTRVQTGAALRYAPGGNPAGPPAIGIAEVPTSTAIARFAVAGNAMCEEPCSDLAAQAISPDRTLTATLGRVAQIAGQANGPRMLLYTGGRLKGGARPMGSGEAGRYADLLGGQPGLSVYPAVSEGDTGGGDADAFREAFSSFAAPFGGGGAPGGVAAVDVGSPPAAPGARTHYAFDSSGSGGVVRIVVIDNSAGSLAASDPFQNPPESQAAWLTKVLADAKAKSIPAVVMGSRDLNTRIRPSLNTASDGDAIAQILVDGGASAYFFDRPEENRTYRVPSGGAVTIPSFGTGTLGYRSPTANVTATGGSDALFGDTGFLMAEIDTGRRDAATNRAPVAVRMVPVVEDLSLQAVDGTLLRRSRVALFQGLGRRPVAGDRWGRSAGDGSPSPPGADPYISFPPALCGAPTCGTRIAPEYEFSSSRPFVGDFVKVDPNTTNLRKPLQGADGKPVADRSSALFCAYNAGRTTVTVRSGGLQFSQEVTVLAGSVQQPCGTVPIPPEELAPATPPETSPPPPPPTNPPPTSSPPPTIPPPPPPAAAPAPPPTPVAATPPVPNPPAVPVPPVVAAVLPPLIALPPAIPPGSPGVPPTTPPPTTPANVRPIPPGGAVARVMQVEEKREEELAPEMESASSRYMPDDHGLPPHYVLGMAILAAFAGAAIVRARPGSRDRRRRRPAMAVARADRNQKPYRDRSRRPPYR